MDELVVCLLYLLGGITIGYYINHLVYGLKRKKNGYGRWD